MFKFVIFFAFLLQINCLHIQNLTGKWLINDSDGEHTNIPGTVPGGIYSDLMDNNIIEDIFYGNNDVKTRWVANKNWRYTKAFKVNNDLLKDAQINLILEGVDTFSKIYLNELVIGSTNNMFVRYEFNIKPYLKSGKNVITVAFSSPISEASKLSKKHSSQFNYEIPPRCVPDLFNGECHVNYIRKMQASFAWDWGPAFPSVGLWKPIYIESFNSSVIKDVTIALKPNQTNWDFSMTTYLTKNDLKHINGELVVTIFTDINKITTIFALNSTLTNANEFIIKNKFSIPKEHFKLWWPNGYGEQNLYQVKATFINDDNSEQSVKRFKIGFRTIELIQDKLAKGRSFYFKVNDVPIFMKGSNSIPIHILPEKAENASRIRFILESSRAVHMNMLRVWGGGMYESNTFYEMADELGILIWQDFMFACSMYPINDEYLNNVKDEVKQQVRRLQHHASVAIWAGNNENEAALHDNWYGTQINFDKYREDYIKLYVKTVKKIVMENDATRSFLISSPTNGIESENEGFIASNPQSHLYGDVHFYNYMHDAWNQNVYPVTRFASEYGYQSYPSVKSMLTATNSTADLNITGKFMVHRQHHPMGATQMKRLINERLILPNPNDFNKYNRAYIFYSQIIQAMAIKVETEFYRQWRSDLNELGEGRTMGALYWQLNDVWVGPTWSSIDFNDNWKMLHYFAKDFFAPILVTNDITPSRDMKIYIVSDLSTPIFNTTLTISTYNWNSFIPLKSETLIIVDVLPGSSKLIHTVWLDQYLIKAGCGVIATAKNNCFIYYTLTKGVDIIAENYNLIAAPLRDTSIKKATVKISSVEFITNTTFKIVIASNEIAAFVWLECDIVGVFSKNGFLQISNLDYVTFKSKFPTNVNDILKSINVTHLLDEQYL